MRECQGWGDGPLKMCPHDCRGPVQALVWQIVEGKMGVGGAPKHPKKSVNSRNQHLGGIHSPGWVHKVCASPGNPLLSREVD
jgi:hypothetical protein